MKYVVISSRDRIFQIQARHYHHALCIVRDLFHTTAPMRDVCIHVAAERVEFRWMYPHEDESQNREYKENFVVYLIDPRLLPEALSLNDFTV